MKCMWEHFILFCLRIIKEHLEFNRVKKNRILDQFDQQYMIFQHLNIFCNVPYYEELFTYNMGAWKQSGVLASYISTLLEELVDTDEMLEDEDPQILAIVHVLEEYEKILQDENLIDFTSIQTEAYRLLKDNPKILKEIQEQIKYIMVDEYQDTNYIQERIVFLLAGEKKNICVVGDDD